MMMTNLDILKEQKENEQMVEVKVKDIILNGFEKEVGLNPWCINEGLAKADDLYLIPVSLAIKQWGDLKC
jgi:hypothetical protein